MVEKSKVLTLSTAYIMPKTAELLNEKGSVVNEELVVYPKTLVGEANGYGWFIYVPDDWKDQRSTCSLRQDFPNELARLLDFCLYMDCQILCLDRDASILEAESLPSGYKSLPTFSWGGPGKRCPKCGCQEFSVTAHVTQDWIVDACGDFVRSLSDCVEVTHTPNDADIWTCSTCGYYAEGSEFNPSETNNPAEETSAPDKRFILVRADSNNGITVDGPMTKNEADQFLEQIVREEDADGEYVPGESYVVCYNSEPEMYYAKIFELPLPVTRYKDLLKQSLDLLWTYQTLIEGMSDGEAARYIRENISLSDQDLKDLGFISILQSYQAYLREYGLREEHEDAFLKRCPHLADVYNEYLEKRGGQSNA